MWKQSYSEDEVAYVGCPLCRADEARDLAVEWSLIVARCDNCGMRYVRRRVMNPEWNYRGERDGFLRKYGPYIREEAVHDREGNYQEIADRIEPFRGEGGGRLLDVGPYVGLFMRIATRRGWEAVGVEQSPAAADVARTHMGLDVRTGYLEDFDFENEFDVVTFLDVLEHIANPLEVLASARQAVRPGGAVLAKVPSGRWNRLKFLTLKKLMGDRIDSFDAREHLLQFSGDTLKDAFGRAGLEPVELFIPRPIQTGNSIKNAFRWGLFKAGSTAFGLSGNANALCPDLCLIGRRTG
jgi:SAM-dependent methyltransferase